MTKSTKPSNLLLKDSKEPTMICSFGKSLRKFPISSVVLVEPTGLIARIPFGKPPFEGLMSGNFGTTPVFNLSTHLGEKESCGKYCVILQTKKGLIRLLIDSIVTLNASDYLGHDEIPSIGGDIDALLEDFILLNKKSINAIEYEQALVMPSRSALILQANQNLYAFDIECVDFIEHHKKIDQLDSFKQIVTLQNDDLVKGISLSRWLKQEGAQEQRELWSIGYSDANSSTVITVESILGIESIPISLFHIIRDGQKKIIWINHPKYGATRLLSVDDITKDGDGPIHEGIFKLIDSNPREKIGFNEIKTIQNNAGIGVNLGMFDLVLPTEVIAHVDNKTLTASIKQKPFKRALPTFDLCQITKLNSGESSHINERRAITVRNSANKNLIFLAPNIYEPSKLAPWEPLPIMPKSAAKIFSAIRVENGRCEMLLNSSALSDPPPTSLNKITKNAFCGWYRTN
ncbi:hypothetical protein [Polynucleobacter sp. MWH-UH2A]|uniref:hypothetical protein n=1 Tax=Polynucleobacter sp. MWH-UH2A TaxID=1855617 RepID=UPI001BFD08E6|nr:hypothetical protein [Polynucleobacter sp. MWH-UH2A]QWD64907.1 hypothetical protein IC571_04605 [Polynucleobacter sp. MWH-UH2A]